MPSDPATGGPTGEPTRGPSARPAPTGKAAPGKDPLRSSRVSGFYTAVVGLGVVLVLLIIFIVQNTRRASVSFLFWEGTAPLAVLLLVATAAGIFLTATAGSLRLLQVRRRVKKERRR